MVCNKHFISSDIKKTLAGRRALKQGAVPAVFVWNKGTPPSKREGVAKRTELEMER